MSNSTYLALSGQLALEKQMATIAINVANAATVGFRRESIHFEAFLDGLGAEGPSFSTTGREHVDEESGALKRTGNELDIAVQGQGYLAVETVGGTAYTRDGRLQMLETGELVTLQGAPVLDAGLSPILLDPSAGPPKIARDGMISQGSRRVGAIGLFALDLSQPYRRAENAAFMPQSPGEPILSFTSSGIVQGFVEDSNVEPAQEMADLIRVSRTFESLNAVLEDVSSVQQSAMRTLAGRS